jgi:hypothetical protein
LRTGAVRHRLDAGDEAAFLDDQFVVNGGEDGLGHGDLRFSLLGRDGEA